MARRRTTGRIRQVGNDNYDFQTKASGILAQWTASCRTDRAPGRRRHAPVRRQARVSAGPRQRAARVAAGAFGRVAGVGVLAVVEVLTRRAGAAPHAGVGV
ncbi:hypothetical protein PG996_011451 [Apiospora saccharicola]|uniref:Uncharacterized protein n=1 Tax=Apiospora saccharicola TaxID=335842 RepID=A0ABR1UI16_9PEZI